MKRSMLSLQLCDQINLDYWCQVIKCTIYLPVSLTTSEDMEFLEVLTEGLERVLLVRGGGSEVITIYS